PGRDRHHELPPGSQEAPGGAQESNVIVHMLDDIRADRCGRPTVEALCLRRWIQEVHPRDIDPGKLRPGDSDPAFAQLYSGVLGGQFPAARSGQEVALAAADVE